MMRATPRIAPLGESFDPFTLTVKRAPSHPVLGTGRYQVRFTHPVTHKGTMRHVELDHSLNVGSALAVLTYAARALGLSPLPTSSHTATMFTREGVVLVNVGATLTGESLVRVTPPLARIEP